MHITFLGGAEEIGASCALLELDGVRLLIDGGQRLGAPAGQALPDFSRLEGGPPIDAVLLTHAHADHVGALPALSSFLADDCPIFATEPTIALVKVMLQDSLRIMQRYRQGDGELPLFPAASVPPTLDRFQTVRWGKAVRVAPDVDVTATWFPAGHILGAGMVEIRGRAGSVLFSGDVSVADQLSVPGVFAPAIQPDILVLESTYGNRLHAHRPAQERRIIDRVRECVAAGGSVLFPTFALGRAQEVLLLLGRAMRDGAVTTMPVFADGLVRAISKVYTKFPEDTALGCRRLWEQGLDPIFPEDLPIRPVKDDRQRERIVKGPPCVVVSSSGMLQGGASQFYARHWLADTKSLVMITGYQDEESPGQALLNLAMMSEDEPRFFKLSGVRTEVKCHVESCWLSAHADNGELVSLATKLRPQLILPVHGDDQARRGLARSLMAATKARVVLPHNGGTYGLDAAESPRPARPESARPNVLAAWPPWDPLEPRALDLSRFHEWLSTTEPKAAWLTVDELAELWKTPDPVGPDDWSAIRKAVYETPQPYFIADAKRPYILHVAPLENLVAGPGSALLAVERAAVMLRELFPAESGLRAFGFYPEESAVRLQFEFPRAAKMHFQQRLSEFTTKNGWKALLNDDTDDADLGRLLTDWLADDGGVAGEISVAIDHSRGVVRIDADQRADLADLARRFLHRTGYKLVCG